MVPDHLIAYNGATAAGTMEYYMPVRTLYAIISDITNYATHSEKLLYKSGATEWPYSTHS